MTDKRRLQKWKNLSLLTCGTDRTYMGSIDRNWVPFYGMYLLAPTGEVRSNGSEQWEFFAR